MSWVCECVCVCARAFGEWSRGKELGVTVIRSFQTNTHKGDFKHNERAAVSGTQGTWKQRMVKLADTLLGLV